MEIKINFSGRAHKYTEAEEQAVLDAMRNADPLTQGKYRDEFEDKFKNMMGLEHAFTTMNATAGLHMAAQLCQFEKGDEVIAPSHTFTASTYPFIREGAKIVWADVDPKTHVVTANTIEPLLTDKTKAIIVVHLYGYVADMPAIMEMARSRGIKVIEDAAQAIGCKLNGTHAGAFGDMGVFSFHSHKNITTLGEGGMLAVKDPEHARIIPMLRHNGHSGFDFERENYWEPAMGNVELPQLNGKYLIPNNYCLGEVECALGAQLLKRLDQINSEKRTRALKMIDALSDREELTFLREETERHNYHLLVARVNNDLRNALINRLYRDKGIKCVVQYYPLDRYEFYKQLGMGEANCPNADDFFDNMISFPFQHWLTDDEIDYMIASIEEVLSQFKAYA